MPRKRSQLHQLAFDQVPILHAAGLTPKQIAAELMVSTYSVHRWLDEHGLARQAHTVYTAPTVRSALDLVRAGASMSETSKAMRIPLATLQYWCRRAGVVSQHDQIGHSARSSNLLEDPACHAV
jgi:hypothetical protein